jgi:hypothetical protein
LQAVTFWFEPGNESEGELEGLVSFYVGPLLISEVEFKVHVAADDGLRKQEKLGRISADAYGAVFVSYSHKDSQIVDQLQKAYEALGLEYLRDVRNLRSGNKWNAELLKLIDRADLFQLCWSSAAKQSEYVRQELRHALGRQLPSFVRPMYWELPMPDPPPELADIHFSYYKVAWSLRSALAKLWAILGRS